MPERDGREKREVAKNGPVPPPAAAPPREMTTVMLRNIPNRYTQQMLVDELDEVGFALCYDFLYLPMDKATKANVG